MNSYILWADGTILRSYFPKVSHYFIAYENSFPFPTSQQKKILLHAVNY